MKTWILPISLTGGLSLVLLTAYAQTVQPPPQSTPATGGIITNSPARPKEPAPFPAPVGNVSTGEELRLNFRDAPIEMVLNYLSDAAGFIVEMDTPAKGKIDVMSSQPVSKDEAVNILNSVLNNSGYAAIRNGRILRIMSKEDAIHADIPVKIGNDPSDIPRTDEIITQIIPIRFVEAQQLVKDLSPMVSPHATIIANEAGNSIAVTDTQANIRHLVEIIKAIDSSAEDVAEIRVFRLKHHDPTEVADLLNGLFSDSTSTAGVQMPFRFGGPGFNGFGGFGGGRSTAAPATPAASGNSQADRIKKRTHVAAVADPRTSSVVVTASKDMIGQIAGMIEQIDKDSPKVAHVSVIHLENADPQQVQQVLQDMFQSSTSSRNTSSQASPLMNRVQQSSGTTGSGTGTTLGGGSSLGASRTGSGLR